MKRPPRLAAECPQLGSRLRWLECSFEVMAAVPIGGAA
jgi:hypothetical protein